MTMRIGVDMAATVGQKSGLGFYVDNVAREIQQLPGDHELVPITSIKKNLNTPKRVAWDQVGLPLSALTKKLDLLWVPAFSAPRFPKPIVMTAHDIFGVTHPDQFSGVAKRYWTKILPESMRRADHLICISEYTKREIQTHLNIPEHKMTVVPQAASAHFSLRDDVHNLERSVKKMGVETPFVLSVGTLEPRKNFERLVEAFVHADRGDAKLVLVGKKGWEYEGIFAKIRKYHLQNTVIYLDYVNEEELVTLYNTCLFFVMPSIYEGFGLPPLEAMACGAPVAVSQNTSLPEVVGEAGIVFDPFDVNSIRERLDLLLTDPERRAKMREASLVQAKRFSWSRTAKESLDIFNKVFQS